MSLAKTAISDGTADFRTTPYYIRTCTETPFTSSRIYKEKILESHRTSVYIRVLTIVSLTLDMFHDEKHGIGGLEL